MFLHITYHNKANETECSRLVGEHDQSTSYEKYDYNLGPMLKIQSDFIILHKCTYSDYS